MKAIQAIIKNQLFFFICFALYLIVGAVILSFIQKGDDVLFFNHLHQPTLDIFFRFVTELGDGIFVAIVAVALLFVRYYYTVLFALPNIISGLVVQFQKRVIFPEIDRPAAYLKDVNLHFVEGVEIHHHNSFPSGHSTSAFATCLMLAIIIKNKSWGLFFFFSALIISLSRVWLVQHFFVDTYTGATQAVAWCLVIGAWLEQTKFAQNQNSLTSLLKRR